VAWLLAEAARGGESPRALAVRLALARRTNQGPRAAWRAPLGRALDAGLALYRRGWVPGAVVGRLSLPYFRRAMV
jgi:hypothetical protein